ncbi:MAG: hypothetical protein ABEJ74_07765 [Haloferacaceae archaeon]
MALPDLWAPGMVLAAFAGGAFGAAVGALPSFVLAGLVVIVGELYALAGRTLGAATPVDVTGTVAFGVVLGPHVAFGGGAAAAAYAASRGYLDTDFEYHEAKHVTRGLGSRPDVLAVGGAFGVLGYWLATLSRSVGLPTDPVALGVVGSALAHRLVFGYSVFGAPAGRLFDMRPFERAGPQPERFARPDGAGTRPPVEPWLPYQYRWSHVLGLGLVVGALGGYVAYVTASAFLAFGICVAALAFLIGGAADVPVTHHMSLPASTVVLASVGTGGPLTPAAVAAAMGLGEAVALGALFGGLGGLVGEAAQRALYAHADTHLDPPAASIVVTSALIGVLALAGVLPGSAWVPLP